VCACVLQVETAVRVKHVPSGIVVRCQQERSQLRNKQLAIGMIKALTLTLTRTRTLTLALTLTLTSSSPSP
jgi:protein subunit release factor A